MIYKLTDQDMRTHNGYQWALNEWHETSGVGDLCGPGWLHAYDDPNLAILLNPIHANIPNPRLFQGAGEGQRRDDLGLKYGYARMILTTELPLPAYTTEQRVRFGIGCALSVYHEPSFVAWATGWLNNTDRSPAAAAAARAAAEAEVDLPGIARWAMTDAPWEAS